MILYVTSKYETKQPFVSVELLTPDGRKVRIANASIGEKMTYRFSQDQKLKTRLHADDVFPPLFSDPKTGELLKGQYRLLISGTTFEPGSDIDIEFVFHGQVYGLAGTDQSRRDLIVPLLWGLPFALLIGVLGAVLTAVVSLILAAAGDWLGGLVDELVQRLNEANLVLPVMAIGVLLYAYYNLNLWLILGLIVALNIFGSPTKSFRAAFLQEKQAGYIESARVYGAGDARIIGGYLLPRILPVVIPQIIILIPNFFFLEATLAIFNISDPLYPTWGRVVFSALRYGAAYGSQFWVLEPIAMMLITGLAFALLGMALNRVLNPLLRDV
jgi:peptide/nickel transport system permease protein